MSLFARAHGSGDRNQMKSYLTIQINLTVYPTTALIRRANSNAFEHKNISI